MFYNLKITIRNLYRNGLYSAINIGGLAVSLAVCILISLWVKDELSYDRHYKNGERMYRLLTLNKGLSDYSSSVAPVMAPFMQRNIPQIEGYCRIGDFYGFYCHYLDYENTKFRNLWTIAVDTSFFDMFDVSLIKGDKRNPLPDDLSLIVSESKAKMLFGDEDPIGKILNTPLDYSFRVTGVMKDIPRNSSICPDILVRFDVQQRMYRGSTDGIPIDEDWGGIYYPTYLKLAAGSDPEIIAGRMAEENSDWSYRLQPLHEMHLYTLSGQSTDNAKSVYMFFVIAILILVIACINHVNLVTARANKRSREISVRKIVGAGRVNLLGQLIGETVVVLVFAMAVATVLIYLLLPFYNDLAGKNMQFDLFDRSVMLIYLMVGVVVLLLAGLYPAFTLTAFRPMDIFVAGTFGKGKTLFRRVLVVSQFTFSGALIVATIAITSQLRYMQNMNLGYDMENILTTELRGTSGSQHRVIMERLSSEQGITGISVSTFNKMSCPQKRLDVWRDKDGQSPWFHFATVDPDFLSFMGIQVVEGDSFSEDGDMQKRGIILNETAARLIGGGESVIGMHLSFGGGDNEVIGVVKDFNFQNLRMEIAPLYINCNSYNEFWSTPSLYIKVAPGKTEQVVAAIEKVRKEYNPDYDFVYSFLGDDFDAMYKSDLRIGKLFTFFALIAILISCLGLFGLVTYIAETKTKEIGIRKVLGASVAGIVKMLSKEFMILVGISMLIAFPLAWYWIDKILQDYAHRISIGWWMFILAGTVTVILTLITVGWQALKAAMANPVKAIKTE
jgi:ABC-type antimicrobial peptide transport system permease subunit